MFLILFGFVGTVFAQEFYESPNLIAIIELENFSKPSFEHGDSLAVKGYVMENHGLTKVGNSTIIFFLEWPNATKTILQQIKTNQSGDFSLMIPISSEFVAGRYIITAEPSGLGYQAQLENDRKTLEIFVGKTERLVAPLKQIKLGIPFDEISCKDGLQLEQKYDGRPACLKPESIPKLVERGWIKDSSAKQKPFLTLVDFKKTLAETSNLESLIQKFGKPHDDIGSGIHIYVYNLIDGTQIWIGYTDQIAYVRHMDANGNLIEDLN